MLFICFRNVAQKFRIFFPEGKQHGGGWDHGMASGQSFPTVRYNINTAKERFCGARLQDKR